MSKGEIGKFTCPICDQEHELEYNDRELCRCGTEFYSILVGKKDFDPDIIKNLNIDVNKEKAAVLFNMEYSKDEGWVRMIFILGKQMIRRAEPYEDQSHLLVSREEMKDEFLVLNLTG